MVGWVSRFCRCSCSGACAVGRGNTEGPVQLDFVNRELTIKLVYYGPALSGKTTNLQALHQAAAPGASGRLMPLETKDGRTLFFDLCRSPFATRAAWPCGSKCLPSQVR